MTLRSVAIGGGRHQGSSQWGSCGLGLDLNLNLGLGLDLSLGLGPGLGLGIVMGKSIWV